MLTEPSSSSFDIEKLRWRGTFSQYFEMVKERPELGESSHHRVWRMIEQAGPKLPGQSYPFFSRQIYGIDRTINKMVEEYFRPAALGFDVRKRILLLVGPVSGGKSSIVTLLKRGLEQFTQSESGALYGIAGCPMHEDPLHLVPIGVRENVSQHLRVRIEGDLCPWCRYQLEHHYHNRVDDVPVERVMLSERGRVGIGTYAPSDPKSQDISDLIGSVDFQAIGQFGVESDPRAYRFDGELNIANRGLIEFQEMLKLDEKFLYHLLSLSQEGNFKTGRYQLISADEVIVGHTNESEYRAFAQNPRNEALLSRMIVIPVPYNLQHRSEVRIYRKLLSPFVPGSVHVAPYTFEAAAVAAIVSRIEEAPKPGGDRMSKLKAYDVAQEEPAAESDDSQRMLDMGEGMDGLDPRFVLNRLAAVLARQGVDCVSPIDVLASLKQGIFDNPFADKSIRSQGSEWVQLALDWYNRQIEQHVLAAYANDWTEQMENLYQNYIDNVVASVKMPGDRPPDVRLLRAIEERMGITEAQSAAFREEIYLRLEVGRERKVPFTFLDHPGLHRALRGKVFDDMRDEVKITTQSPVPDAKVVKRMEAAATRLVQTGTFCSHCATEAIAHVGNLLNR